MEIWKAIKGYEGIYEISNLGRVKSFKLGIEKLLKPTIGKNGYYTISLCENGIKKTKYIHQLVAIAFLNHIPCGHKLVVDHKNQVRYDCRLENLQIITQRENTDKKHLPSTSKYVGVSWINNRKKWQSYITINGKVKHLGLFNSEIEAHNAYQSKLNSLYL